MAAFSFTLFFVSAWIADASKFPGSAYKVCSKEKKAQDRVRAMLLERRAESAPSQSLVDWVPAVSLEAQQGKLPHQQLEQEFRKQFEEVIGTEDLDMFEKDLKSIMHDLSSTFASFKKNEYGDVGHTAVRYALHRLFVARHGWYIQGLDPEGQGFSGSSPADVLKDQVPEQVQGVVEKLLYGRGFGLYETAVLAAVLENLIHKEAISRADTVFEMLNMDISEKHSALNVDFAIDNYMAAYIMGQDVTLMSKSKFEKLMLGMNDNYPGWKDTQAWTRAIRASHGHGDFDFEATVAVLIEISEKYGKWQHKECQGLKKQLMDLENERNGCVPVENFYKGMIEHGKFQFSESPDYLRNLGALDESDPNHLQVLIPNYLGGASNCIASSSYYSVCCVNECEEILGRIEQHIQGPDALPMELANLVSTMSSSTVQANRTIPVPLMKHLEEIAHVHDGRVPLHSRLFMQWMHNAYPHECPYPHKVGTTSPMSAQDWLMEQMVENGKEDSLSKMKEAVAKAKSSLPNKHAQCGKWLDFEELYIPWSAHPSMKEMETRDAYVGVATSAVSLFGALASAVIMLLHTYRSLLSSFGRKKKLVST
jgi:hypothetical protein